MIIKRLLVAQAVLLAGLGSVLILPSNPHSQAAGVILELPSFIAPDWSGQEVPVTERERQVLAGDTSFVRKRYTNRAGDGIFIGIVLSGEDMANSIHRPERCLPAQGATLQRTDVRHITLKDGSPLDLTCLHNLRSAQTNDGKPLSLQALTYYWFVGTRDRTASHYRRTFLDIRDRLLHGENQRWAYVTAEAYVTEGLPGVIRGRSETETAAMIENFLPRVIPSFQRPADETPKVSAAPAPSSPAVAGS